MVCLGLKPGAAGWLALRYGGTPSDLSLAIFLTKDHFKVVSPWLRGAHYKKFRHFCTINF